MDDRQVLTNYVRRMTNALLCAGVTTVVISPGSRSTPLAYAFASNEQIATYMQIDERSAGYFALGLAKASNKPVALLCTSGTAASNYHPAITEAYYARIPLVVLTADRPHELREVGAPQTIDQIRMYGEHVKASIDFPIPENREAIFQFIERHVIRAVGIGQAAPKGPVHINIPFREPLLIDFEQEVPVSTFQGKLVGKGKLDEEIERELIPLLQGNKRGLLVVGEMNEPIDKQAFWKFAASLQWPVLCDPLSNLRAEVPKEAMHLCIDQYDALLKSEAFSKKVASETVLRFGAQPVSKPLMQFFNKYEPTVTIVVDESPQFRDPFSKSTYHVEASVSQLLHMRMKNDAQNYTTMWSKANEVAHDELTKYASYATDEGAYVQQLLKHLPTDTDVISSSSMPIRDVDTFFEKTSKNITLFANRGANGIDGVVSTAFGIQAARQKPAWLLIGDLAFLHDVNGLIVSRFHHFDLTIVVMNNDGGGIFSYLPQAGEKNHFEQLFGTPTSVQFEHIACMYGTQYRIVSTQEEFLEELQTPKTAPIRIIEVMTNRQHNVQMHRELWKRIVERLEIDE